nr:MAG TPA: hypothetical protein [Crassvirales sp.]
MKINVWFNIFHYCAVYNSLDTIATLGYVTVTPL